MARFEIIMPKMGESIIEATITKWLKSAGDKIEEDDPIAEIATDKVDSEIPSPVEGILKEIMFKEGDVIPVGKVIAVIETGGEEKTGGKGEEETGRKGEEETGGLGEEGTGGLGEEGKKGKGDEEMSGKVEQWNSGTVEQRKSEKVEDNIAGYQSAKRFYSPLVKSIAEKEKLPVTELEKIPGTGKEGRVTKQDILDYLQGKPSAGAQMKPPAEKAAPGTVPEAPKIVTESGDEIIEMDRIRKLIADHMVLSVRTSPHVNSFIDVDVTKIVNWRDKVKDSFFESENEKLTYTHVLMEACAMALKEFPGVNASVDGNNIIHRKKINIGMATALPNGNLIVPVIKDADEKSLLGIIKEANDLANRARNNRLLPDEIQGGTFTVTNFGTFDSLSGTPIINQPQVAILGIGAIRKKPVVIETDQGDLIGIRSIMILSLAYDHRVVDGALGGMFLKKMKEILEDWDEERKL